MGGCCSKGVDRQGVKGNDNVHKTEYEVEEGDDNVVVGDDGVGVRLQGYSKCTSMFTQQGSKGINQDAMAVWENFNGEKDVLFCGVFDGHGPFGHMVARHVRDVLPLKLSSAFKQSRISGYNHSDVDGDDEDDDDVEDDEGSSYTTIDSRDVDKIHSSLFSSWKASFIESFNDMDEELSRDSSINCYCSGTTAVTIVKQGDHLIIANLGDSRAILGTRNHRNQLVPAVLTVDLKPNIPSEAERIRNCRGRIFAMEDEPGVYRMWLPDENSPGLAMARAFGDFCLKNCGLISTPEVTYRKLTEKDEFVVLATDGVWDVLTNDEVIKVVGSARKRSMAAKLLVDRAVREWRLKYPGYKADDCAVLCLFIEHPPPPSLNKLKPEATQDTANHAELVVSHSSISIISKRGCSSINGRNSSESKEDWSALEGDSRVNSLINLPRFLHWRKTGKDIEGLQAHC